MDDSEDIEIGERTWKNSLKSIEKDGYREGHEIGRQESFQDGFDQGYKDGFEAGFKMAYQNASLCVSEKYGLKNESEILTPHEKPWQGNCEVCKKQSKS